jgi:hypothetical protein
MRNLIVNGIYRHYKGNNYLAMGVCTHSETLEEYVVYQALYGEHKLWIRPLNMFLEGIDVNKSDNITRQKHRFEFIGYQLEEEEIKKVA